MPQKKPAKKPASQLLVERELVESPQKAAALIMAGQVFSGERRIEKAGEKLTEDCMLEVRGTRDHPWVSRGGVKLAHGLDHFVIDVQGLNALDVGASTGGFTDVLLHNGAAHVWAVDSGTNQLAWKLRQDDRVTVLEQTNARHLAQELVPGPVNIIVCDASFISLTKVLPASLALAAPGCWLVALIKPQFEAERHEVAKGGVVTNPEVHQTVCQKIVDWAEASGWEVLGVTPSPITGPHGNVEFLLGARLKSH